MLTLSLRYRTDEGIEASVLESDDEELVASTARTILGGVVCAATQCSDESLAAWLRGEADNAARLLRRAGLRLDCTGARRREAGEVAHG